MRSWPTYPTPCSLSLSLNLSRATNVQVGLPKHLPLLGVLPWALKVPPLRTTQTIVLRGAILRLILALTRNLTLSQFLRHRPTRSNLLGHWLAVQQKLLLLPLSDLASKPTTALEDHLVQPLRSRQSTSTVDISVVTTLITGRLEIDLAKVHALDMYGKQAWQRHPTDLRLSNVTQD